MTKITKGEMIKEIIMAVNAQSERTKGTMFQTKKADGDLFFTLAFRTEKELKAICGEVGIKLN
jgi:hypothetical protein